MSKLTKVIHVLLISFIVIMMGSTIVKADGTAADGETATEAASAGATGISTATPTGSGLAMTQGDVSAVFNSTQTSLNSVTSNVISSAVSTSSSLNTESDKIAGGLAVLVIVLTFIEYAGTHHPISAWVKVFENLFVLGIFSAVYTGYTSAAPGFYGWFQTLASDLGGVVDVSTIATDAGNVMQASFDGIGNMHWSLMSGTAGQTLVMAILQLFMMLFCVLSLVLSGVVLMYFSYIGMFQAAIGIVFGKIAIALGFHQMTRGFFKSWLNYMVHAGMYTAVSAGLNKLVISTLVKSLSAPIQTSAGYTFAGLLTSLVSAIFVLLLALEIPKIAAMFGGGATAAGTTGIGLAKKAATAGMG